MVSFKEYKKRLRTGNPSYSMSKKQTRGIYNELIRIAENFDEKRKLRFTKRYKLNKHRKGDIKFGIRGIYLRIKNFIRFLAYIPRHIIDFFSSVKWERRQYDEPLFKAMKSVRKRNKEQDGTLSYVYWEITHKQPLRIFFNWVREKIILKLKRCEAEPCKDKATVYIFIKKDDEWNRKGKDRHLYLCYEHYQWLAEDYQSYHNDW